MSDVDERIALYEYKLPMGLKQNMPEETRQYFHASFQQQTLDEILDVLEQIEEVASLALQAIGRMCNSATALKGGDDGSSSGGSSTMPADAQTQAQAQTQTQKQVRPLRQSQSQEAVEMESKTIEEFIKLVEIEDMNRPLPSQIRTLPMAHLYSLMLFFAEKLHSRDHLFANLPPSVKVGLPKELEEEMTQGLHAYFFNPSETDGTEDASLQSKEEQIHQFIKELQLREELLAQHENVSIQQLLISHQILSKNADQLPASLLPPTVQCKHYVAVLRILFNLLDDLKQRRVTGKLQQQPSAALVTKNEKGKNEVDKKGAVTISGSGVQEQERIAAVRIWTEIDKSASSGIREDLSSATQQLFQAFKGAALQMETWIEEEQRQASSTTTTSSSPMSMSPQPGSTSGPAIVVDSPSVSDLKHSLLIQSDTGALQSDKHSSNQDEETPTPSSSSLGGTGGGSSSPLPSPSGLSSNPFASVKIGDVEIVSADNIEEEKEEDKDDIAKEEKLCSGPDLPDLSPDKLKEASQYIWSVVKMLRESEGTRLTATTAQAGGGESAIIGQSSVAQQLTSSTALAQAAALRSVIVYEKRGGVVQPDPVGEVSFDINTETIAGLIDKIKVELADVVDNQNFSLCKTTEKRLDRAIPIRPNQFTKLASQVFITDEDVIVLGFADN